MNKYNENNEFKKVDNVYVYKPNRNNILILILFIPLIYIFSDLTIEITFNNFISIAEKIFCIILTISLFVILTKMMIRELLSITISKTECVLSVLFYKKRIAWKEFKVIKYETYKDYKRRSRNKYSVAFPYKGCVIFSIGSFKKSFDTDPDFYYGKTLSWFYINFYDKNDVKDKVHYTPCKFSFDEEEFKELVKEIGIQIENYPYN